jgi:hypothetical protein
MSVTHPRTARDGARPSVANLRRLAVGDRVPDSVLARRAARRIDATAMLIPGVGDDLGTYRESLRAAADAFAGWDGRVVERDPDGGEAHRLLVVDRYGQVYDARDAATVADLPSPAELEEWFKFLATACPECGVLDEPILEGPTP